MKFLVITSIAVTLALSGCTMRSYSYQPARPYGRYEGNDRPRNDRREERDDDRKANRYERRDDRYNRATDY